jgi:hypothetical protein
MCSRYYESFLSKGNSKVFFTVSAASPAGGVAQLGEVLEVEYETLV